MSLSKTDRSKKEEHKVSQMSPKRPETTEPAFKEFFLEFLKSEKLRRDEESRLRR